MKKILAKMCMVCLLFSLVAPFSAQALVTDKTMRIGLYYNTTTVMVGNLKNVVGSGYRFGYYDSDRVFHELADTDETKISVMITQNLYMNSNGIYSFSSENSVGSVGCYHVQLPESYTDYASAKERADAVEGGFVAWIGGTYFVRSGSYVSKSLAQAAAEAMPIEGCVMAETSAYGYSVVPTGATNILFQFDGAQAGETYALGVEPNVSEGEKGVTALKGYQYYGGFRFERLNGENKSTIVNMVDLEDYVKGVIPYEMSASWPLEALKAQAVCARTYAVRSTRHSKYHFDLCNTTDCQVYYGTSRANANSDQAVDETAGLRAMYNGSGIDAVYSSSNGGASEDAKNVWGNEIAYLKGKLDPYEADVADTVSGYSWTTTYTAEELKERLHSKDYLCGDIVNFYVSKYSDVGNAIEIKILDADGKSWTFSRNRICSILGIKSIRFTVSATAGGATNGYAIAERADLAADLGTQYAISGDGTVAAVDSNAYAITGSGVEALRPTTASVAAAYTISGTGWGHNVGMSQWGAYAMAQRGMTYDEILKFYYTGITIE